MSSKNLIDVITETPNVLGQIYSDLASPSVKAIGSALGTVFEFSTCFLLPVKLLNEKFKANFAKRLDEYQKKLLDIPEEKRCEVHPQIGTPIIEKLSYTTTDEIADLFTTLLANASNQDTANLAHPSFIGIIEKLSTDEARIIQYLKGKSFVEYCDVRANIKNGRGFNTILPRQTLLQKYVTLDYPQNIQVYLDNLICLGILEDQVGLNKINEKGTDEIKDFIHFNNLTSQLVPSIYASLDIHRGFFNVTDLGKMFINACIK